MLRGQCPALCLTLTADASQVADLVLQRVFGLIVLDGSLLGAALAGLLDRLYHVRPAQRLLALVSSQYHGRAPLPRSCNQLFVPSHVTPQASACVLAPWLANWPSECAAPRLMLPSAITEAFSRRELEVLRLVVDDHCNEEIAGRLCVSVRTVESHRRTLLHKAGTRTMAGLAARAVREGWVA